MKPLVRHHGHRAPSPGSRPAPRSLRVPGDGVAVTVMTNYGFHQAMERESISVATTPVGDRNVLAELIRRGWALGGGSSATSSTPDSCPRVNAIASALLTMEVLAGRDLAGARRDAEAAPAARERARRGPRCA